MGFVPRGKGVGHGFGVFLGVSFFLVPPFFWGGGEQLKLLALLSPGQLGSFRRFLGLLLTGSLSHHVVSGTVSDKEANFPVPWDFF